MALGDFSPEEYHKRHVKRVLAHDKILKATRSGQLIRPSVCELCGATPKPITVKYQNGTIGKRPAIVGHHWNGYDNPLDIWWICQNCNVRLQGDYFHCGLVTKEEARETVSDSRNLL